MQNVSLRHEIATALRQFALKITNSETSTSAGASAVPSGAGQDIAFARNPASNFIGDIEVLRAFAVIIVIFGHAFWLIPFSTHYMSMLAWVNGWPGVDLFFCISGFVISRELLIVSEDRISKEAFLSWSLPFWIKRCWRILPSAWFWASFALLTSVFWPSLPGTASVQVAYPEWIAAMTQSVNLYYASCAPSCAAGSVFNNVYWSLGTEDQFYVVLPFILLLVPQKWLAKTLICIFLIQFFIHRPQTPLNFLWYTRTDAITLGVLIALGHKYQSLALLEPTILENYWYRLGTISFLMLMLVGLPFTGINISTGMIAVISGFFVLIASFNKNYIMRKGTTKSIMMWIGSRSFALYLVHLPAFAIAKWLNALWKDPAKPYGDHHVGSIVLIAIILIVSLAEINFRVIERPLRRYGRLLADRVASRNDGAIYNVDFGTDASFNL